MNARNPRRATIPLPRRELDYAGINAAARRVLPALIVRWLPGGRRKGLEYVALNPRRIDRHAGSFKINLRSGRWADFATGDAGHDPISLLAYLAGIRQGQAARRLADMLGVYGGRR